MNIVITGASSGIGQVVAEYLAKNGHQVIGTSRYKQGRDGSVELMLLDVTQDESVKAFTKQLFQRFETVDVLINNAGYVISGPVENISIAEAQRQLDTNYFGAVRLTQKLLPHFRLQNKGKIINISSMAGHLGMPFQAHYSASKFALEGFTESLRLELVPFNIQVCNINPGDFKTSISANRVLTESIEPAYQQTLDAVLQMYKHEEENGSNPILIAKLIHTLIYKSRWNVRYIVGKPTQTIAIKLKRIFGAQIFENVIKRIWKLK